MQSAIYFDLVRIWPFPFSTSTVSSQNLSDCAHFISPSLFVDVAIVIVPYAFVPFILSILCVISIVHTISLKRRLGIGYCAMNRIQKNHTQSENLILNFFQSNAIPFIWKFNTKKCIVCIIVCAYAYLCHTMNLLPSPNPTDRSENHADEWVVTKLEKKKNKTIKVNDK